MLASFSFIAAQAISPIVLEWISMATGQEMQQIYPCPGLLLKRLIDYNPGEAIPNYAPKQNDVMRKF